MILNPTILVLLFLFKGCWSTISSEMLIILLVESWPRWCQCYWCHKLRTATWEELVIGRVTWECHTEVDVVTVTVADDKIVPITQHIACIWQRQRQLEVVVRPTQTLTPSDRGTEHLNVLVVIKHRIVVIAITCRTITVHIVHVVIIVTIITIAAGDITLLGEEQADIQGVRTLTAKPAGAIARRDGAVVATVGLNRQRQLLTVTNWHDTAVHLVLAEEVTHREIIQFDTDTTDDTSLTPT